MVIGDDDVRGPGGQLVVEVAETADRPVGRDVERWIARLEAIAPPGAAEGTRYPNAGYAYGDSPERAA